MFGLGSRVASTAAPAGGVFSRSSAATSSLVWSIYGNAAAVRASQARAFRTTPHLADVVIPYMLTDVGEGIAGTPFSIYVWVCGRQGQARSPPAGILFFFLVRALCVLA